MILCDVIEDVCYRSIICSLPFSERIPLESLWSLLVCLDDKFRLILDDDGYILRSTDDDIYIGHFGGIM